MQLYMKSLITGFPDEWLVIPSSITFLVNALGVENGHGFFDLEALGVRSTVQHRGDWATQNSQNCFILVSVV